MASRKNVKVIRFLTPIIFATISISPSVDILLVIDVNINNEKSDRESVVKMWRCLDGDDPRDQTAAGKRIYHCAPSS